MRYVSRPRAACPGRPPTSAEAARSPPAAHPYALPPSAPQRCDSACARGARRAARDCFGPNVSHAQRPAWGSAGREGAGRPARHWRAADALGCTSITHQKSPASAARRAQRPPRDPARSPCRVPSSVPVEARPGFLEDRRSCAAPRPPSPAQRRSMSRPHHQFPGILSGSLRQSGEFHEQRRACSTSAVERKPERRGESQRRAQVTSSGPVQRCSSVCTAPRSC